MDGRGTIRAFSFGKSMAPDNPMKIDGIQILSAISDRFSQKRVWLCDIWGVLHNGVTAFPSAIAACKAFRKQGGTVILISNSPRPSIGVAQQLLEFDISNECYDAIVTSGDVTRVLVAQRADRTMYHMGPERDRSFFDGLPVTFVSAAKAEILVCTGLFDDETEAPVDYDTRLAEFAARHVPMICGNPDVMVERGDKLIPCAGALALRYEALGQTVIQAGKPYPPIYTLALAKAGNPARSDIVAIGDGIDTDIKGASQLGIDAVYVASRVHLTEGGEEAALSSAAASDLFRTRPFKPVAAMDQLVF